MARSFILPSALTPVRLCMRGKERGGAEGVPYLPCSIQKRGDKVSSHRSLWRSLLGMDMRHFSESATDILSNSAACTSSLNEESSA